MTNLVCLAPETVGPQEPTLRTPWTTPGAGSAKGRIARIGAFLHEERLLCGQGGLAVGEKKRFFCVL